MSLLRSRPLSAQSPKAKSRMRRLQVTKRVVLQRARFRCESCGLSGNETRLELHHVAMRGHIVSPEWADSPELCAVLCPACHRVCTDKPLDPLTRKVQEMAAARLSRAYTALRHSDDDPLDSIRRMVDKLEAAGVEPR